MEMLCIARKTRLLPCLKAGVSAAQKNDEAHIFFDSDAMYVAIKIGEKMLGPIDMPWQRSKVLAEVPWRTKNSFPGWKERDTLLPI